MSFGVSPSDIVKAVEFAVKIYDYGFAEENRKDVRYRNFRNDILNFRILLQRLEEALISAQEKYSKRGPTFVRQPYEPLSREFETERKMIIGNFLTTLEECDALLKKNKLIRERNTNVWENLMFNLRQQEARVEHLRHRLHFHSQKIRLVIDRLSLGLLTDIDAKVDDILAISEQNLQVSNELMLELKKFRTSWLGYISGNGVPAESAADGQHSVSPRIAQKFQQKLFEDAPADLLDGIPLQQGFDALLVHLEQSCKSSADQTPELYLQFLKARWLLDRLKEGSDYKNARPGFYYKRAINQVEQAISERIGQPGGLISYDENSLLDLADSCFQVWPPETPCPDHDISQPSPLMVRAGEEQVAHINLAQNGATNLDTVTAFKVTDEQFRVVHESNPASTQGKTVITPYKVDIREDKLIPLYLFPTLENPCLDLAIISRNEEQLFKFGSLSDVHKLQTALMGYDVAHDQGDQPVRCQLKFKHNATVLDSSGRVQLWQDPIAFPSQDDGGSPTQSQSSSLRTHSRHDSLASSIPVSSAVNMTAEGYEAVTLKLPSIAVFTQLTERNKTRFALFLVNLEPGMYINPKSCSCHRGYDECANLVIESQRKQIFTTYILQSDTLDDGNPNPSSFDIFPMRLPQHPDFHKLVTLRQTEYVLFKFKSLEEKKRFHAEMNLRFKVRDEQIKNKLAFERKFVYEMEKPRISQKNQALSPPFLSTVPARSPGSLSSRGSSRNASTSGNSPALPSPINYRPSATEEVIGNGGLGLNNVAFSRSASVSAGQGHGRSSRTNSTTTVRSPSTASSGFQAEFESPMNRNETRATTKKTPFWKKL